MLTSGMEAGLLEHWRDGTTDVTRTVWLRNVPDEFRKHFTLVLIGHINTAALTFPDAISGIADLSEASLQESG